MYCIKCGVKLADTEKQCPLCGTVPFHPELSREEANPLYPQDRHPEYKVSRRGLMGAVTILFLIPLLVTALCDLQINGEIVWAGYVVGGLLLGYSVFILPGWFEKPNPVIFVPISFGVLGLFLLYISWKTDGGWFLSFGFPVAGFLALLVTALVTLLRYIRRGRLYIFGGALATLGIFMPVMELLLGITFEKLHFIGWSWYPLIALVLLGGMLIFLAICRPAREKMERRFFL